MALNKYKFGDFIAQRREKYDGKDILPIFGVSREGFIFGEKGFIKVTNINNPEKIEIYLREDKTKNYATSVSSINIKEDFNGYEYQLLETYNSITSSKKENPSMILDETLKIMSIVDEILHKAHYINY